MHTTGADSSLSHKWCIYIHMNLAHLATAACTAVGTFLPRLYLPIIPLELSGYCTDHRFTWTDKSVRASLDWSPTVLICALIVLWQVLRWSLLTVLTCALIVSTVLITDCTNMCPNCGYCTDHRLYQSQIWLGVKHQVTYLPDPDLNCALCQVLYLITDWTSLCLNCGYCTDHRLYQTVP